MDGKGALCGPLLTRLRVIRNIRIRNNQKIKHRVLTLLECRWDQMDQGDQSPKCTQETVLYKVGG